MQLQHELHDGSLARIFELLYQCLLVGSAKRFCLAPHNKHVVLPIYSDNCERSLTLNLCVLLMKSVHKQIALPEDFDSQSTLPLFDCLSSWAHNL